MPEMVRKLLWLDVDPGHDDVCALLLALHSPSIELVGVSSVHGNASLENTTINAAKALEAFAAPTNIKVWPGASKPLIGLPHPAADIHGNDGLGGVEGLPSADSPGVQQRFSQAATTGGNRQLLAIAGLVEACQSAIERRAKLHIGVTGAATNVALFLAIYPDLAKQAVEQIVLMAGGVGIGNTTPTAEFNVLIDPEATQMIFESGLKIVCIPLNVTHQVLFHDDAMAYLLDPLKTGSGFGLDQPGKAVTPLRHTLRTLFSFFAETYKTVFGFQDGPPIHDMLVVAHIIDPALFGTTKARVDVERGGTMTKGTLSVDTYGRPGSLPKNVEMAMTVDVSAILREFFIAIGRADKVSPLNEGSQVPDVESVEPPAAALRVGKPPMNQF